MTSKLNISHIALSVFCFAGLFVVLQIFRALAFWWFQINIDGFATNFPVYVGIGMLGAGLVTLYSEKSSLRDTIIAAVLIGLFHVGTFLYSRPLQDLHESFQPLSSSISITAMCVVGALLGGRLAGKYNLPNDLAKSILGVGITALVILGTAYISLYFIDRLSDFSTNLAAYSFFLSLVLLPMYTGYLVQANSRSEVDASFLWALTLLLLSICFLVAIDLGLTAFVICFIVSAISSSLYFLLAKVGSIYVRKQKWWIEQPTYLPSAKTLRQ